MRYFAGVDLDTITSLNHMLLYSVQQKFTQAISDRLEELDLGETKQESALLKELSSLSSGEVITHLENYIQYKKYESILPLATLKYSPVLPSLDDLMFMALKHAPNDWRARGYLLDDCELIHVYRGIEEEDTLRNAATYSQQIVVQKQDNDLMRDWQRLLRRHYISAMNMNLHVAREQYKKLVKLDNAVKKNANLPYVYAWQIVRQISILQFLARNMGKNKYLNEICDHVIYSLDNSITKLKDLSENLDNTNCCTLSIMPSWNFIKQKEEEPEIRNFLRYKMIRELSDG